MSKLKTTTLALIFFLLTTAVCTAQAPNKSDEIKGILYNDDEKAQSFTVFFDPIAPVELVVWQNGVQITGEGGAIYWPYEGCQSTIVRVDAAVGNIFVFALVDEQGVIRDTMELDEDLKCKSPKTFSGLMDFTPGLIETSEIKSLDYDYSKGRFMLSVDIAEGIPTEVKISKPDGTNFCDVVLEVGGRYNIPIPLELEGTEEMVSGYGLQSRIFFFAPAKK